MLNRIAGLILLSAVAGCATEPPRGTDLIADPYEKANRQFHAFNKGLDQAVISPASKVYGAVTPTTIKFLVGNALGHLDLPVLFANHLLQGEMQDAAKTLGRFAFNTVYGAGGFLDPATEFGMEYVDTDFGITLGNWGVGEGIYLELPVLGPSTTRHAVGRVVDLAFKPTTYLGGGDAQLISYGLRGIEVVDFRDRYRPLIDEVLYESEDSYITSRASYIQNRRRLEAGETAVEELPDIFEQQ